MIYGYARVSTNGQAKDGTAWRDRYSCLKKPGAEKIYKDAFTGTKTDRPELKKILSNLQPGDKPIVTSWIVGPAQGGELIESLLNQGVAVHVLSIWA